MKKLLLILLCLPIIGFGQEAPTVDIKDYMIRVIEKRYDKILDSLYSEATLSQWYDDGLYFSQIALIINESIDKEIDALVEEDKSFFEKNVDGLGYWLLLFCFGPPTLFFTLFLIFKYIMEIKLQMSSSNAIFISLGISLVSVSLLVYGIGYPWIIDSELLFGWINTLGIWLVVTTLYFFIFFGIKILYKKFRKRYREPLEVNGN